MTCITILGCGPSYGVPSIDGRWFRCRPDQPKNRRTRTGAYFTVQDKGGFLIDASPDLHAQCRREKITRVDGIFLTHAHADHINGLDDVKIWGRERPVPVYGDYTTLDLLQQRLPYAFGHTEGYGAFLRPVPFTIGASLTFSWGVVQTFAQDHRYSVSVGYRFPGWAYSTDAWNISAESRKALYHLHTWFVDCLDWTPCPTHAHWDKVQSWIQEVTPQHTYLIHMNGNMDYDDMRHRLPKNVSPAYDGLRVIL